jgi:small conductance mechanosensitive channel
MERLTRLVDVAGVGDRLLALAPHLATALLVLAAFWLGFRISRAALRSLLGRSGLHETLVDLLVDKILRFALVVFALLMAADQLGIQVRAALAGVSIVGLAVGFAAQDTLANIIAGFVIFIDKPFLVGDWVRVADSYGRVFQITLRTTRIRTRSNTYVVIPNKKIIDEILVNHSKHGSTRVTVPIGIAYKESIPAARSALLPALAEVEGILEEPAPDVVVSACGASSVDLEVHVWVNDAGLERPAFHRVLERSKLALDAAGIQIPYPHLQLFVDDVEERVWRRAEAFAHAARAAPEGGAAQ